MARKNSSPNLPGRRPGAIQPQTTWNCFDVMGKTILTVDDAATMRKLVSFTLKSAGHETLEAQDGAIALTMLQSRSVDLVITDVHMPNMNGLELTRQLRSLP